MRCYSEQKSSNKKGWSCCVLIVSSELHFQALLNQNSKTARDMNQLYQCICNAIYSVKGNHGQVMIWASDWCPEQLTIWGRWTHCRAPDWSRAWCDCSGHKRNPTLNLRLPVPGSQDPRKGTWHFWTPAHLTNVTVRTHGWGSLARGWGKALDYMIAKKKRCP